MKLYLSSKKVVFLYLKTYLYIHILNLTSTFILRFIGIYISANKYFSRIKTPEIFWKNAYKFRKMKNFPGFPVSKWTLFTRVVPSSKLIFFCRNIWDESIFNERIPCFISMLAAPSFLQISSPGESDFFAWIYSSMNQVYFQHFRTIWQIFGK